MPYKTYPVSVTGIFLRKYTSKQPQNPKQTKPGSKLTFQDIFVIYSMFKLTSSDDVYLKSFSDSQLYVTSSGDSSPLVSLEMETKLLMWLMLKKVKYNIFLNSNK